MDTDALAPTKSLINFLNEDLNINFIIILYIFIHVNLRAKYWIIPLCRSREIFDWKIVDGQTDGQGENYRAPASRSQAWNKQLCIYQMICILLFFIFFFRLLIYFF